jgi:hypothetical protein
MLVKYYIILGNKHKLFVVSKTNPLHLNVKMRSFYKHFQKKAIIKWKSFIQKKIIYILLMISG